MIRSLHGKLSLVLMLLLVLTGALLVPLTLFTTRSYNEEVNQHLNRDLASHLARDLTQKGLLTRELKTHAALRESTKAEISHLMALNPNIEIYLLDENGAILDYSAAPGRVQLPRVALSPLQRFLAGAGSLPIYGTDPRKPSRDAVFSASKLPIALPSNTKAASGGNALRGFIYIVLAGEDLQSVSASIGKSYILRLGIWGIGGVLVCTFGAAILLFPILTRPLRRLVADLEAFRRQELKQGESDVTSASVSTQRDEIGQLEDAFARLSSRVGGQVQTLQQADIHRREAVSNVSHDLRTPLAALQGYLETLLIKEGQLSPEVQREYLMTAMKHAERLNKLIAALFELAKLDSPAMQPNWEDFSLAELAQDVVQQFSLAAEKNEVQLRLECPDDLPFVRAEIGLVERVLENLLENALRHTPPRGMISLSLHREAGRVILRVADNGEGIAPQHLPHIFERSYRGVAARSSADSKAEAVGAGLGLAISKRIAELHGGELSVQSELNRGSLFTFSLPLAPVTKK